MKMATAIDAIVAWAICRAHRHDPDHLIITECRSGHGPIRGPKWTRYRTTAIDHIAAWDALRAKES